MVVIFSVRSTRHGIIPLSETKSIAFGLITGKKVEEQQYNQT